MRLLSNETPPLLPLIGCVVLSWHPLSNETPPMFPLVDVMLPAFRSTTPRARRSASVGVTSSPIAGIGAPAPTRDQGVGM